MFGKTYYHDTLRKYVILFGTLFNDVWINRVDADNRPVQSMKIPLSYGPREKFLARIDGVDEDKDPLKQPFATVMPRMSFEITGFNYAPERKLPTRNKFVVDDVEDGTKRQFHYNPVPYDINFQLNVFVKNTTDGLRIIEQILPFFTPEWTATVKLIESPEVKLDIPTYITSSSFDDVYEGSFEERRSLIWTLDFTMKGFFFGPSYKQPIINLANTQLFDSTIFDDIEDSINTVPTAAKVILQPGLLANNTPTVYTDLNSQTATGIATIADGEVSSITIVDHGKGYSFADITISGGGGTGANAEAIIDSGDSVESITINDAGSNYTSTPTVTISSPDLVSIAANNISSNDNYGEAVTIEDPFPTEN